MSQPKPSGPEPTKLLVQNKKARFDYHVIESVEAGMVLTGEEIKSIRTGGMSIAESYVRPHHDGGMYLMNAHVRPYDHRGTTAVYDPVRPKKLLLHRREIDRLRGSVAQKGLTIVPLRVYLKRGLAKLEIALAKGKDAPDKRAATKEKEAKRELGRVLKGAR